MQGEPCGYRPKKSPDRLRNTWKRSADGELVVSGSFRRRKETVGDLDVLVVCQDAETIMNRFVKFDHVDRVLSHGHTRASIQLRSGLQVDLRVVDRECFGAALHYFTGSQAHNIAIRRLGRQKGLKINEYGVFEGDPAGSRPIGRRYFRPSGPALYRAGAA